jgi:UPF0716 family protein affecting phage T7 exclusion
MPPLYSDDQPEKPDKQPVEQNGIHRFAISQEFLLRMRAEGALLIRENDWERYVKGVRTLKDGSSNWIAAAWALLGIAASLAGIALTVPGQLPTFGGFALLCAVGAAGCLIANRQVNQKHKNASDELAREMEAAGDMDRIEIIPLRPGEDAPPSGAGP